MSKSGRALLSLGFAAWLVTACSASTPPPIALVEWQVLHESQGLCQMAIPKDYKISEVSKAEDASGKISVSLNGQKYTKTSPDWNTYKTNIKRLSKPVRTIADDATLLYYDSAAASFSSSIFLIAKPGKDYICSATISVPKADAQRFSSILSPMVASLGGLSKDK